MEERIVAIIATHAEPLVALLRESRREHTHCEDPYYCCARCQCRESIIGPETVCTCGAEAWNKRVVAALEGR